MADKIRLGFVAASARDPGRLAEASRGSSPLWERCEASNGAACQARWGLLSFRPGPMGRFGH
jgi:hypothetical protein